MRKEESLKDLGISKRFSSQTNNNALVTISVTSSDTFHFVSK